MKRNHGLLEKQIKITPNKSICFNKNKYRINTNQNKYRLTGSKNEEIVDWSN